jgi:hypothetical protein
MQALIKFGCAGVTSCALSRRCSSAEAGLKGSKERAKSNDAHPWDPPPRTEAFTPAVASGKRSVSVGRL